MILYTKPDCDKCEDIKKVLANNNISFLTKDTKDPAVISELRPKLSGMSSPLLLILELDDGTVISNDMGIYRALRERGLVGK